MRRRNPGRCGHARLSRRDARRLRAPRRRRRLSKATRPGARNISSSSIATSRAASAAFSTIISTAPATPKTPAGTPISPSRATSARAFIDVYSRHRAGEFRQALDGGRPRGTAGAARALCRVQPALRPRHDFRAEDRRQRRTRSCRRCLRQSGGLEGRPPQLARFLPRRRYCPFSPRTNASSTCGWRTGSPDSSGSRFCSET